MPKKKKNSIQSGRPQISGLDANGHEIPDPTPHAASLKVRKSMSVQDQLKQLFRSQEFEKEFEGKETFDEADDFDVDDDFDPNSPYEELFEGEFAYHKEQRLENSKEATIQARRGRQPAPRDAEPLESTDAKRTPEPTLTEPQGGGGERGARTQVRPHFT